MSQTCSDRGCDRPSKAKGVCLHHYYIMRRDNPDYIPRHMSKHGADALERLATIGWSETLAGCWEWKGDRDDAGYGCLRLTNRTSVRTHRVAWESARGPVPDGLHVLHRCDNPQCVNPRHLFLGTHQDNDADRDRKGRTANGTRIGSSKLSDEQVGAIRLERAAGATQFAIARQFGISQSHVSRIVNHVNRAVPTRTMDGGSK